jgi:hypothetical protein
MLFPRSSRRTRRSTAKQLLSICPTLPSYNVHADRQGCFATASLRETYGGDRRFCASLDATASATQWSRRLCDNIY